MKKINSLTAIEHNQYDIIHYHILRIYNIIVANIFYLFFLHKSSHDLREDRPVICRHNDAMETVYLISHIIILCIKYPCYNITINVIYNNMHVREYYLYIGPFEAYRVWNFF